MTMIRELTAQLCAFSVSHDVVIVVQRWSGFARSREALVVSRNAQVVSRKIAAASTVRQAFAKAADDLALLLVDEQHARLRLEAAGHPSGFCASGVCGAELPIAAPWCPVCGLDQGRSLSGRMSGVNRRAAIVLRVPSNPDAGPANAG